MTGLGGVLWGPTEVMLTLLLTSMLLGTQANASHLPPADSRATQKATRANKPTFPYRFWLDGKGASRTPTSTPEPSYEFYYKKDEDLGTDPSTWKLLPIQIPDDLVSGASIQEEVTVSSLVPPYPTSVTPQYGRHPGATTEPLSPYPPEGLHQGVPSGQGNPESQQLTWKRHDSEGENESPESQVYGSRVSHERPGTQEHTWEIYDSESSHKSHESQKENWDHNDNKVSHIRPALQQGNWDHQNSIGSHRRPKPEQENWDPHDNTMSYNRPESQEENWDQNDNEMSNRRPETQQEKWDHHDNEVPETQQESWSHHDDKMSHVRPEPQKENWDSHDTDSSDSTHAPQQHTWASTSIDYSNVSPKPQETRDVTDTSHRTHEPQQHTWGSHSIEHNSVSPQPQHPNWGRHDASDGHGKPEPRPPNWDHHGSQANHGTLEQEHSWDRHDTNTYNTKNQHKWSHHGVRQSTQHDPPSPQPQYYNWTHTADGYEIRNYHEEGHLTSESHVSNQNSDHQQHLMPNRPVAWNWKPPDTPSWHQNIVERIGQHLPKLPALPKLRLPRLPKLPQWLAGGYNRRVHDQGAEEIKGEYQHKFYPLVPENNPLEHLDTNLDRHHRPHYRYPPRQGHKAQNTLDLDQSTDQSPQHQTSYSSPDGGDSSSHTRIPHKPQRPTRPHHHVTQDHGHHSTRNEPQMSHQKPQGSHEAPQPTHYTRRPSNSPQRVLKVPHRQAYEGYLQKHHSSPNKHKWTWEGQQKHTTAPQRDPLNRYPSPLHNWPPQGLTRPSNGHVTRNSTRHGQHYRPQTQTQRPYSPSPSHGRPQHQHQQHQQQQQGGGSSWFSAGQQQQAAQAHDNILDPLSNLLSRPSPYPIIDSSTLQQSIIDRLTGAGTSATTTTLSIPGGLLVLGLALALFYFNFVWYPTPVVTAKIYKMLSDNTPTGSLDEGQQRAVGEVYQVFRSLEKEYKHDPSAWSAPCRSRLVCQVHQELPGLWGVTQAYAALVKSNLASGPEGDSGFSGYQAAAKRGSQGGDCAAHYHECALPAAPIKATLRKLFSLLLAA